jgi:hypothetical protein
VALSTPQDLALIPALPAEDLPITTSEQQVMPQYASRVADDGSKEQDDLSRRLTAGVSSCESVTDKLPDQGWTWPAPRARGSASRTQKEHKTERSTKQASES